jgi:hypothetical protein
MSWAKLILLSSTALPRNAVSEIELGVRNNIPVSHINLYCIPHRPNDHESRSHRTPDRCTYAFITLTAHYTSQRPDEMQRSMSRITNTRSSTSHVCNTPYLSLTLFPDPLYSTLWHRILANIDERVGENILFLVTVGGASEFNDCESCATQSHSDMTEHSIKAAIEKQVQVWSRLLCRGKRDTCFQTWTITLFLPPPGPARIEKAEQQR